MLGGGHGLVLSAEIVGVSDPERVYYSRSGINHLIDSQAWSLLAGRLSADKVLVPLAFRPDEGAAEVEFTCVLIAFQAQYFDVILESPPGIAQAFLLKGELAQSRTTLGVNSDGDNNDSLAELGKTSDVPCN
jgi:hypothetical protein